MTQLHVDGIMLKDIVYSSEHYGALFTFLQDLKHAGQFGFVHNDAHSDNIMYDSKNNIFVLIDYGRVVFNKVFGNKGNKFLKETWIDFKNNKNISDLIEFDDPGVIILASAIKTKYQDICPTMYNRKNTYSQGHFKWDT
jgi:hypothetical protein